MPRISHTTITRLKELDLISAIGRYVPDLKKKGANYVGTSPFTTEKTPSFTVSPTKGLWKCFSSGKAGFDVIKLYQELNPSLDFFEVVKQLCYDFGEELVFEDLSPEKEAELKKAIEDKKEINSLFDFALSHYLEQTIPDSFIKFRGYKQETIDTFQLGYAPDSWSSLVDAAKEAGFSEDLLIKSGLARKSEKNGSVYDFFRDRVIFPIFNTKNQVVAFSGRAMKPSNENPKYLHVAGAEMSQLIFGLKQARGHIKDGKVYAVEGPTDVLRCWDKGIFNVVCSCGGSYTQGHIKLLIRAGVNTLCFIPDNDLKKETEQGKNPGIQSLHRNAELALATGLNTIRVIIPEKTQKVGDQMKPVIEDFDPDNFLQKLHTPEDLQRWLRHEQDYIHEYLFNECERIGEAGGPPAQVEQHRRMADVINAIKDDEFRAAYYDTIANSSSKFWKLFKKTHKVKERNHHVDLAILNKLTDEQKGDYFSYGFQEQNNCYVFKKGSEASNFIIEVLFYVYSNEESKVVCILNHANGRSKIAPLNRKDFITLNALKTTLVNHGPNWQFTGNQQNLDQISMKLFEGVKEAREPIYMGYNSGQNFYTFANGLYYEGRFFEADRYGIVTLKKSIKSMDEFFKLESDDQIQIGQHHYIVKMGARELAKKIGEENLVNLISDKEVYKMDYFFLPFASSLKLSNVEDDDFEFERTMVYKKESEELTFSVWAKQVVKVYGDNGKVMIAFFIMALFRDIIYKANNNWVPILNHYGMPGSGKSKAAESLAYMFGEIMEDGINLESGSTETGIRRYLAAVSNGIIWLNEYKNTIHESKRGMLKGITDGSGKVTGRKTSGNQVKTYKPKSTAIICGQDIPTIDPALIERCIFSDFDKVNRNKEAYDELKEWEKAGRCTHVTVELLGYRDIIKGYKKTEPTITKQIWDAAEDAGIKVEDRPVLNATSILTPVWLLMQKTDLEFPFTFKDIMKVVVNRLKMQVSIKAAEDDVEKFFSVLGHCIDTGEVKEGEHYEIRRDMAGTQLYLRLRQVMPYYKRAAKFQDVIALQESTLKSYLQKHACYIKFVDKNVSFSQLANSTSAHVLNYDILLEQGIELKTKNVIGSSDPYRMFAGIINRSPGKTLLKAHLLETISKEMGEEFAMIHIDKWILLYNSERDSPHDLFVGDTSIDVRDKVDTSEWGRKAEI